jgi:hypothetical protein
MLRGLKKPHSKRELEGNPQWSKAASQDGGNWGLGLSGRANFLFGLAFRSGYTWSFQAAGLLGVRRVGLDGGWESQFEREVKFAPYFFGGCKTAGFIANGRSVATWGRAMRCTNPA